ncbi:uncharacterized protein LOC128027392 isoform X13 [Carassius gibelio]|uniref:uncharacterized protein LOC128027392 isoform X9 n=1 Tax=Carassius gibelio TaxID=101364 RepID=UPI002278BE71|nr:uncharacterized protein LOC128027392 isoform X9 [Carassius gibelio]XP_052470931.1 uncharacterized protein LOC128027392 isoform X10 [Carassius gibelio]XP_052470933.1 uncharacterized protein LOC128027392 isoform X12 [Carassius gibelio]XP_052470934.1 uncharacterized protein LOC128027392 isoform X13 [Carassius gibelio]
MMLIFGLMLLLQTAACVEWNCSFNQSDPCYTALGDKLNLVMVRDASEYDLKLKKRIDNNKKVDQICRVKYSNKKECDLYNNRTEVTVINGTVLIKRVIRSDSGNYTLTLTDSDGTETSRDLQVIVEAPIGSVNVSIICSSSGVMRVFCSSDGDQLLYSWTLNGGPLMDGNSSIDLDEETDGNISCSVKNHVSHTQKTIRLKPCPGPDRFCSFNQSDSCYAAVGDKLNLLLVRDARDQELHLYKMLMDSRELEVFRIKNKEEKKHESIRNRSEFIFDNGTLIINRVIRADSGNYRLEFYHSDGSRTFKKHLLINIEAPIGSVEVTINCSSNHRSVFCSSDGDQLLYNWTLNGEILEQGPMNGNTTIQLNEETDGDIICSVKNHVSHAQKTIRLKPCPGPVRFCSFNQTDPCYTALGDKLHLPMVLNAMEYDLKIRKKIYNTQDDPVCRVKQGRIKECDLNNNRTELTVINGTLIINRVIRSDSGNYTLTLSHSDGTETSRDLQVIVEAPIGSVNVSIICSSSGVMRVSCSSEGDQLLYSWTLNGGPLMDGNSSIDLDERTDGDISCSVKNHVSHTQKTIRLKPCPGLDRFCSFDQSDHCYTALEHKLNLLMVDAREYELHLKKRINNNTGDGGVCRVKNDIMRMSQCDLYNNRPEVTVINGTVIIKRVIRSDSGNYRLSLSRSNGTETSRDLQVIVEAPIGSVEVSIICSSNQRSVFCSSDGDQIIYNWTLNGEILEQGPMNGNTTFQLKEETDGDIICSVKNHVSHAQTSIRLQPCPGPTTAAVTPTPESGLDNVCWFGQSDHCYTALGDKLNLMMVDAREYDLTLKKRINYNTADGPVCRVKNDILRMSQCDLYNNRPEVTVINGTVIIKRVIRADSGNYRLTLTESDGTETSRDLQVIVEAPIGSVEVLIICSCNRKSVFCSSDGDQIIYSWTLNGEILEQGPVDGNTIQLNEGTDRNISCSVRNHVSHAQKTIRLKPCPGPTTAAVTPTPESGLDQFCSFNQSDPCYTALGDKLNLLMMDAREYDLQLKKRINDNTADGPVCRVKNDIMRMSQCDLYKNRPEVTVINGTVIIKCVNRSDSGNYTLTLSHSDGTETSRDLQVIVEAPIGSVEVLIICSSNQRSVFCSSDGDQIIYNWTLNGEILEQGSMNGNTSIQLNEGTDGDISCSVKNHVSHTQKTIRLKPCPGPTTAAVTSSLTTTKSKSINGTSFSSAHTKQTPTQSPEEFRRMLLQFSLIALGCVALILILLFITLCYIYKKKQVKSTQAASGDMELIYADISHEKKSVKKNTESFSASDVEYAAIQPQTKRKKKKKKEEVEEVQYGEVTFTPKQATAPQQKLQEECVYSQVQRD